MHVIILASYLTAAVAFLVVTGLLAVGWRGQRTGALLIVATTASVAWGVLLVWAEWVHTLAIYWVLLAEALRYGAWLLFLGALLASFSMSGLLRGVRLATQGLWALLALYCLWPVTGLARWVPLPFNAGIAMVGVLMLALIGVVFLEQLFRNVDVEQRWAIKFLVIALGVMFAYDVFLYSYAVLYRGYNVGAWAARGFVDALLAPVLVAAAARSSGWAPQVGVSRRAVFYSTSLLVIALYFIATAVGGYFVRLYGGNWGRVAEITLIFFAVLAVLLVAASGQARSRLKMFLHKNFFSFRHDYREEWLRLTATLSASDNDTGLPLRAVRAIAQIMDSPAGALLMRGEKDAFEPAAGWNMSTPASLVLPANLPVFELMLERRWVYDLTAPPPLGLQQMKAPAELENLPHAWLLVPLVLEDRLIGVVVLAQARARRAIDWEDLDLLRTAGTQVAGTLAQAANARRLAEARQFEGFNRLTAFLMHDLKNVAAQQSLLLQNAARHRDNPAFVDDMLATVENAVQRITRLLEQLRGEATPVARARVRLDDVLERALAECGAQAPRPVFASPLGSAWVRADAGQLATVLGHLIRNAQDAATAQGHVAVRLGLGEGQAMIEIEDDGMGMDEDFIRNRLFKPFFTTKASKGMGIGAYQAREYVRALGGSLVVRSTPGRGSVFTVGLPLAEPADDTLAAPAGAAS
ncbi:MAG TPA: XrtA/PEP-CTERM system histidine kinase PrsK [Rhodanobacteraceae bacterium]|nr:XrtA/PEP-CTERM system histidine kinase PrsK [Rhodanobacteraceae bacterium]